MTNYACLSKGDTININYQGRDYLIDIVECKPVDNICVVEADIEVDFKQPLDYKEVPLKKNNSKFHIDNEEDKKKMADLEKKHVRLDGKSLTDKQKKQLLSQDQEKQKLNDDFDPRKHRLQHGIRNYQGYGKDSAFLHTGKGVSLK